MLKLLYRESGLQRKVEEIKQEMAVAYELGRERTAVMRSLEVPYLYVPFTIRDMYDFTTAQMNRVDEIDKMYSKMGLFARLSFHEGYWAEDE